MIPRDLRPLVGSEFRARLAQEGAVILCLSAGGQHVHGQAKMRPAAVDHWVGLAKRHVTFSVREHGRHGKVWAKRCKVVPILNRGHQENVFGYIPRHAAEGAWVWTFRDPEARG